MTTLYYNGDIITMEQSTAESILIKDGIIEKLGNLDEILSLCDEKTKKVDLNGKTLMPSFIDPHGHLSLVAQMVTACNLSHCETIEEIIGTLRVYLKETPTDESGMIFGYGYDHNFLTSEQHPTKEYLDQISTAIPICLLHTSAHMGCVNSKTLELSNITERSRDPEGGVIGRYENSQEPNGYLEENALFSAMNLIADRIHFDPIKNMKLAQKEYLKNGVTTVQDGATDSKTFSMLKHLNESDQFDIDVVSYPIINDEIEKLFNENIEYSNQYCKKLKLGGYKIVLDGSPQGKSAWLTKPYENSGENCGYPWFQDEQVYQFLRLALDQNKQVLIHCNGDAAGDQLLNVYQKALCDSPNENKNNLRPVMIHCQTAREDQLDIMAKLNMIPSIFVGHVYYWGDVHVKNLGTCRGFKISPAASAFQRNLIVNFHQDPPVTEPNPLFSVWAAVNRLSRSGNLIGPEERCTVYEGLKAITINAAYSYFEEDSKGSLTEGKRADIVILDQNPLKIHKEQIKNIKVLETIKDGLTRFVLRD